MTLVQLCRQNPSKTAAYKLYGIITYIVNLFCILVSGDTCNCASQQSAWLEDEGDLMDWFTEYLPVMQLRIGDTGTEGSSEGYFTLGKLYCYIGPGTV